MPIRSFALACIALFLAASVAAQAHVRITPVSAPHRATLVLAFRVPDERGDIPTTRVDVQFPQDRPIASARVEPTPGWTSHVVMSGGHVDEISWSSTATAQPHMKTFRVLAGPLPASGAAIYFKAIQTYADGTAVRWIQIPNPGEGEPPNPAPQLRLRG
jgi:uncharacterized protein YcnI